MQVASAASDPRRRAAKILILKRDPGAVYRERVLLRLIPVVMPGHVTLQDTNVSHILHSGRKHDRLSQLFPQLRGLPTKQLFLNEDRGSLFRYKPASQGLTTEKEGQGSLWPGYLPS